jgi:hypothetical protein
MGGNDMTDREQNWECMTDEEIEEHFMKKAKLDRLLAQCQIYTVEEDDCDSGGGREGLVAALDTGRYSGPRWATRIVEEIIDEEMKSR